MKNICITLILILTIISGFSQTIEINSEGLFINSTKITGETSPAMIREVLGEPNEIHLKANTIWTYQNLGILVYISPKTNEIGQITLEFINQGYDFSASSPFSGKLKIFGMTIYKETSLKSLKNISQLKFEENPSYKNVALTTYLKLYLHDIRKEDFLEEFTICFKRTK